MHNTPAQELNQALKSCESMTEVSTEQRTSLCQIIEQDPFLYAYLRDLVRVLGADQTSHQQATAALQTMGQRMAYFHHWDDAANQTIGLIQDHILPASTIKPHIRHSDADYQRFYETQNAKVGQRVGKNRRPLNRLKPYQPLVLNRHFDHCIRKSHAVNVIETMMAVLESSDLEINRKWLDIGCGNGLIANAVHAKKHGAKEWQIYGCDLQSNKIKIAQNRACKNRHFYQQNVLDTLQANQTKEDAYDVVSMFEFCEHFADPFALLKQIAEQAFKVMVIATPLCQKTDLIEDNQPDPVHLWSFSVEAIKRMLAQLNLTVIMDVETRVGEYNKGMNWLTVVACKPEYHAVFKSM
ncbi:class I SAM-dependent methyltransferase [Marinicella meishanensis]|uniref:class I SAM-dependent methyltransferase n=1 Tax=Marinicella meishanensis TaxID=2873263 RepID=UPI001CBE3B1E|nr:class I SAM-dependent methyltransferase [Marinicella sp. NBU2979]